MIKKTTLLAVTLSAISSLALAQNQMAPAPAAPKPAAVAKPAAATPAAANPSAAAPAGAGPAAAAPAAEPPKGPPKAPAENDMFKKVVGTWRCDSMSKGPDGKDMKVKTTWSWKSTLGGQWYAVVYKRTKTGPIPAFEGNGTMGYNGGQKKYVFSGFDSMGGWIDLTSADGMAYAGKGEEGAVKIAFAKGKDKKGQESDKLMDVTLDLGSRVINETCKK